MKLVWHLIRTDFRRMALPLAFWALLVVAKNEFGVRMLRGSGVDSTLFETLRLGTSLLLGIEIFVQIVLVALLVQEDALVGTRMFWVTRPIAGARLLAAKVGAAVLMFGVLPILLSLRWWLACGEGFSEIVRASLQTLDEQMAVTLLATLLAMLTAQMSQFLGWLFAAAVGAIAWIMLLARGGVAAKYLSPGTVETHLAWFGLAAVGATIAAIVVQFCTRQRTRAVALILAAGVVASLIFMRGPQEGWSDVVSREKESVAAQGVTVAFDRTEMEQPPKSREQQGVRIGYVLHGIPDDRGVRVSMAHTLSLPGGASLSWRDRSGMIWPEREAWRALDLTNENFRGAIHRSMAIRFRGEKLGSGADIPETVLYTQDSFAAALVEKMRKEPPRLVNRLQLEFIQPVRELEVAVKAGAGQIRQGYGLRVSKVVERDGLVVVNVVETQPASWKRGFRRPDLSSLFVLRDETREIFRYVLVNRARDALRNVVPSANEALVGTQLVRWWQATLEPPEWMEGVTLDLLRYQRGERFQREVTVEQLILPAREVLP